MNFKRLAVAGLVLLGTTLVPTGCSINIVSPSKAPATPSETATSQPATNQPSAAGQSPTTTPAASAPAGPAGKTIPIPAGTSLKSMDLLYISARPASETYGKGVAVLRLTNTAPLFIDTKITLFDAAGTVIGEHTSMNTVQQTGTHNLITSNLIPLAKGKTVSTYQILVVNVKEFSDASKVTALSAPVFGLDSTKTPALTGTFDSTAPGGITHAGLTVRGACVDQAGRIVAEGENAISDRRSGTYKVSFFDAVKDVDLSATTCFISA
jgi:hypothetical protein